MPSKDDLIKGFLTLIHENDLKELNEKEIKIRFPDGREAVIKVIIKTENLRLKLVKN